MSNYKDLSSEELKRTLAEKQDSVNVSSYGSFSISGGSNYDERGSQKTISW